MTAMAGGQELIEVFQSFFRNQYRETIGSFAIGDASRMEVDWYDLYREDRELADDFLNEPDTIGEYASEALRTYDLPVDVPLDGATVALTNLPDDAVYDVGEYRSEHVNQLIGIRGVVNKETQIEPIPEELCFECTRCGTHTYIPQSDDSQEPHQCSGCERQGPFTIDYDNSTFRDYKLIRVQLPPDKSQQATEAHIDVELRDDLVNAVGTGDRAIVNSILRTERRDDGGPFKLYAEAKSVQILETDFEDVSVDDEAIEAIQELAAADPYSALVESFAPEIYGNEHIKEAIVLQLFGGEIKPVPGGGQERGYSHVGLIGDPGTGKSRMLEYAADVAPRSVFSGGKTSSAAGLTASAVRDDFGPGGEWTLEGGALVKADKGLACIDELDKAAEEDRNSLHEALEQMRVSVSKAGINTRLSARTMLLAAMNPARGRFDETAPVASQIDLDPALISRFDLLFTFKDKNEPDRDKRIISHKTDVWRYGAQKAANPDAEVADVDVVPELSQEFIRQYIAYAKRTCKPVPTPEAETLVETEFEKLRQANADMDGDHRPVPVTFRKQNAIHRLAEASARVRLSDTVEERDARRAVRLVRRSLQDVGMDPESGHLDADVIETGVPETQRNRIQKIKAITQEFADEHPENAGAPRDAVKDFLVEEFGFTRSKVEHDIEKLLTNGELYRPADGWIAYYE